jgi:hypothetical protein
MTEQPAAPAAGKPPSPQDAATATARERIGKLRAQLLEAEAALPQDPGTVRLKVMPPHDSFTVGGFTIGKDPVPVPAGATERLMSAAADSGVTIEEVPGA